MRFCATATFSILISRILGYNNDTFNYRETINRDFGPKEWDQVTCDEQGVCLGWPDSYESRIGWNLTTNQCQWCPDAAFFTRPECKSHLQSPIPLHRILGTFGHSDVKECKDYHWMAYFPGSCRWKDIIDNDASLLRNNFIIDRHALQIMQPVDEKGDLKCGFYQNKFPRVDFARGFPEWWNLYQTELKMPSEHSQGGKQYDAEVQLDHVYSIDRDQREIAKIAIFLQGYEGEAKWDFLEKLICQWREVEETNRKACCLPSVPMYASCRNPVREGCGFASSGVELGFDCSAHDSNVNFPQMCNNDDGGCCESPRSDTNYCHGIYDLFGESFKSACYHCCEPSKKDVAPPAPEHAIYPRIQCSSIEEDVSRICMTGGCCDPEYSGSEFCQGVYDNHPGDEIHSICWYCCSEPKEVGVTGRDEFKMEEELSASPPFDCLAHASDANFRRICQEEDGCCESPRSDSNFCHRNFDRFGEDMISVCKYCCEPSKQVGSSTPDHPKYPRIECSSIDENTARMCKTDGCCNPERSSSRFCQQIYKHHSDDEMHSICWYCCSEPKDLGRRNLRLSRNGAADMIHDEDNEGIQVGMSEYDLDRRIRIDNADYEGNHEIDSDTTGDDLQRRRRRRLVSHEDVKYDPYEWMRQVKTEYYYRYEGSQTVPPCFTKVHWRVMKDPIRVHPDQIRELQRLLAHRIAPFGSSQSSCELDTAGKPVNENIVEVNRPLQLRTALHGMTFCECRDWTSKFEEDRDWCNITDINERFYEHPYNFDSNGGF